MLHIILMAEIPIKKITIDSILLPFILLAWNNKYPISKLKSAQSTFMAADDSPLPGGLAKGVGNLFPEIPCTKCGTILAKKTPEKKAAIY
ncbi:MAG: hypothetical protein ABI267_02225 [Ginsengibacter sp.]